jgi:hypothetical protein
MSETERLSIERSSKDLRLKILAWVTLKCYHRTFSQNNRQRILGPTDSLR